MADESNSIEEYFADFRLNLESKSVKEFHDFFIEVGDYFSDHSQHEIERSFLLELGNTTEQIVLFLEKNSRHPILKKILLKDIERINDLAASLYSMKTKSRKYFKGVRILRRTIWTTIDTMTSILLVVGTRIGKAVGQVNVWDLL